MNDEKEPELKLEVTFHFIEGLSTSSIENYCFKAIEQMEKISGTAYLCTEEDKHVHHTVRVQSLVQLVAILSTFYATRQYLVVDMLTTVYNEEDIILIAEETLCNREGIE